MEVLTRSKELTDREVLNCLWRAMDNGVWLMDIPQRLNVTELSREEFQDNLLLSYGILPLNLSIKCDGCGKNFLDAQVLL